MALGATSHRPRQGWKQKKSDAKEAQHRLVSNMYAFTNTFRYSKALRKVNIPTFVGSG